MKLHCSAASAAAAAGASEVFEKNAVRTVTTTGCQSGLGGMSRNTSSDGIIYKPRP